MRKHAESPMNARVQPIQTARRSTLRVKEVPLPRSGARTALRSLIVFAMACGSTQLGCQTMGPVPSCGLISQQETKPSQATSLVAARADESSPAQALATDAIVRGQSPDQNYNRYTQPPATNGYAIPQSTPGSNDYFRGPMNPSGAAVPTLGGPPNVQPNISGSQPTTAYQMPTGTVPYGAPATSPYGPGGMSPATDAPFIPNAPMQPYVPSGSTAPPIDQAWAFPSSSFPASHPQVTSLLYVQRRSMFIFKRPKRDVSSSVVRSTRIGRRWPDRR